MTSERQEDRNLAMAKEYFIRGDARRADLLDLFHPDILARETGSTVLFATFQQDLVIESLEQAASWVYNPRGEVFPSNIPASHSFSIRRPLRVVVDRQRRATCAHGGVRDSGWGRTGPDSIADFTDTIWINARTTERQYPF